jgi:hypothetical protein
LPNGCWQSDFTHYRFSASAGGPALEVELISWLDDHSRLALSVTAHARITGAIVVTTYRETAPQHGTRLRR